MTESKTNQKYSRELSKLVLFAIRNSLLRFICENEHKIQTYAQATIGICDAVHAMCKDGSVAEPITQGCGALLDVLAVQVDTAAISYIKSISNKPEALYLTEFELPNSASASHQEESIK